MNTSLKSKTEKWMSLERKTFEQRALAEKYYEEELMSAITDEFIKNNKGVITEPVEYLIVSVGTSYEPIVLSIKLLQPKKILFLYTTQSEPTIDKVADFCHLKFSMVEKRRVNETKATDIYREIKEFYTKGKNPGKVYIDFTGGTKAMATAAAMAGAMIDLQMIYVGSNQYMQDFRKPFPGSERLFVITNPIEVFGDIEIDKAYSLFDEYNFSAACEKLEMLKRDVPDPKIRQELSFVYDLSKVYEYWDSLEFSSAYKQITKLNNEIERDKKHSYDMLLLDKADHLMEQEKILTKLNEISVLVNEKKQRNILSMKEMSYPLMFTLYQNALVREQQEKLDMSSLLLYRLLEMIEQRRLAYYGLYVSDMDYLNIKNVKGDPKVIFNYLKEKVFELKKIVFGKCNASYLPDQVSLMEGFIILAALNDKIFENDEKEIIAKLKKIRAMVSLRNNGIFAHGLIPVKEADYLKFKGFVEDMFKDLCKLEEVEFEKNKAVTNYITLKNNEGE